MLPSYNNNNHNDNNAIDLNLYYLITNTQNAQYGNAVVSGGEGLQLALRLQLPIFLSLAIAKST